MLALDAKNAFSAVNWKRIKEVFVEIGVLGHLGSLVENDISKRFLFVRGR